MSYPVSEDQKIDFLNNMILQQFTDAGLEFSIEGTDLFHQEVAGHFGCLNLFLLETQEVYEKISNQKFTLDEFKEIGLNFNESEKQIEGLKKITSKKFPILFAEDSEAYFNCSPYFDYTSDFSFAVLAHFTHFTIDEILKIYLKNKNLLVNGRIPLDNLYSKWKKALDDDKIILIEKANIQKKKQESR